MEITNKKQMEKEELKRMREDLIKWNKEEIVTINKDIEILIKNKKYHKDSIRKLEYLISKEK